jgi:dipeptidyl aminopeptidase/acylaminoacyl peptidase
VLTEFDSIDGRGGFTPLAITPDGTLFASATRKGSDKAALYRVNTSTGEMDAEPLVALKDFDFNGELIMSGGKVAGIQYRSDAQTTVWFDEKLKAVQAHVDATLKNTINTISVPVRPATPYVLVHAFSDVDPGSFMLFNMETSKFAPLGAAMRDVDPRRMATRDFVKYKARDGLTIPAWVTMPRGGKGKKLPMVVLVHGGPWIPGATWQWESQSQFLASRGYLVVEPEFRGTTGYGWRHFRSSWKQWGLAMQDDLADGAKWAIEQGMADPKRICIAGASYGGYATLMGLVNDPELFKCGLDWVGVTDFDLLYSPAWGSMSTEAREYGMPRMLGDLEKDAERFAKTSPLVQAARIKQPLMLAYGGNDGRVPVQHGVKFRDAVTKTNSNVEWIEYKDEGHGWVRPSTNIDFWTRVEKFLARNIGTP